MEGRVCAGVCRATKEEGRKGCFAVNARTNTAGMPKVLCVVIKAWVHMMSNMAKLQESSLKQQAEKDLAAAKVENQNLMKVSCWIVDVCCPLACK